MKIKITDLLDSYYDESIKFTPTRKASEQTEPTPIIAAKKQRFKKPLTAVACFILLACGTSLLGLRFLGGNEGASLSQPEAPEIPMMDVSVMDESLMEPEEAQDSSEYNSEVNTHTVYTAYLDIPIDGLSMGLESDGADYLSLLTIDPVNQTFRWSVHLPGLEALRWETYPEDGRNSFDDETYTEAFSSWVTYLEDNFCRNAVLRFADGSELTLYGGESLNFDSNLLNMEGTFDVLEYDQTVTVADYIPVELALNGVSYEFTPAEIEDAAQDLSELPGEDQYLIDASEDSISLSNFIMYDTADESCSPIDHCTVGQSITLSFQIICKDNFSDSTILNIDYTLTDAQQNVIDTFSSESSFPGDLGSVIVHTSTLPGLTDTPGYYNLELQLTNELGQIFTSAIAYSVADPDTHYDPAQDTDGDGYLTAWLTYDTPIGTVVKLQLNVTENTFAWYIHNEELIDAYVAYEAGTGDWDTFDTLHIEVFNDLLNYFNNAYIVFTDGTKVPVGGGDSYRLEDDLFREESLIALTGASQDYYPAYLEFDGTRYDFE